MAMLYRYGKRASGFVDNRSIAASRPISGSKVAMSGPCSRPVSARRSGMNSALPLRSLDVFKAVVSARQGSSVQSMLPARRAASVRKSASAGSLAASIGGFALAYAAGTLFVPAPAGAGVREAVLGVALVSTIGGSSSFDQEKVIVVVLLSRVLLAILDFAQAGGALLVARARRAGPAK